MAADPTLPTKSFHWISPTHTYKIHWTSFGNTAAPPLIFIHGTPWSSRVWAPYALAFASRFHVYLFDNPGFGLSPGGLPHDASHDLDASLAGQAVVFSMLFKSWELKEQPHVIAHDNGGLISLRANLLHDCEYASLCLVDVVAIRPFGSPFFRLVGANPEIFNKIPDTIFEGLVHAYVRGAAFKSLPRHIEDMLVAPWLASGSQGQQAFIRQIIQADLRHAEEVEGRYGELAAKMPVKIIWGKEDQWIPVGCAGILGTMIGTKDVVLVEDAGHLIHYDQPERLGVELGIWLAGKQ